MTTYQKRTANKINNYYNFLCDIKKRIDDEDYFTQYEMTSKHKVSNPIFTVLNNKGVITKAGNGNYKWTTTVNPSKQMAAAVYQEVSSLNAKRVASVPASKRKNTTESDNKKQSNVNKPKTTKSSNDLINSDFKSQHQKYLDFLTLLKNKCDKEEVFSFTDLVDNHNVSRRVITACKRLKILEKTGDKVGRRFIYKWASNKDLVSLSIEVESLNREIQRVSKNKKEEKQKKLTLEIPKEVVKPVQQSKNTKDNLAKAIELNKKGVSNVKIAEELGVSEGAIRKWFKKHNEEVSGKSVNKPNKVENKVVKEFSFLWGLFSIKTIVNPK